MNKKPTKPTSKNQKTTQQKNSQNPPKRTKKSIFRRSLKPKPAKKNAALSAKNPAQSHANTPAHNPTKNPAKNPVRNQVKKPAASHSVQPAPINKKTDRELSRVMNEKSRVRKKRNFRGGNYSLYFIFAAVVIVIVLVILSNTVLFRCTEIEVSGNVRYTPEQIIQGSGLKKGDNILHVDANAAAKRVVDVCLFVDEAEVRKTFPTKLVISIKEAEICFCVPEGSVTAAVSGGGRVIKHLDAANNEVIVKGYEPESLEVGAWLKSKNKTKTELPWELLSVMEAAKLDKITEIDISDRYSIKVLIDNRIILNLGGASELESKFLVAKALIDTEIGKNDSVTISLTNPEKPAVRLNT